MLAGLILRGVSFDFRAKTSVSQKPLWDKAFKFGSLLTSFCQGYMLGRYVLGFAEGWQATGFAILSGLGVSGSGFTFYLRVKIGAKPQEICNIYDF